MNEQLALFGDEAADLEIADLEGLLVAGAALVQRGAEARLSIVVSEQWRAITIVEAFDLRGLPGEEVQTFDAQFAVRTPFHRSLMPLASRWSRGSSKLPPPDWRLTPACHGEDRSEWLPVGPGSYRRRLLLVCCRYGVGCCWSGGHHAGSARRWPGLSHRRSAAQPPTRGHGRSRAERCTGRSLAARVLTVPI